MPLGREPLTLTVTPEPGFDLVSVSGELDLYTQHRLVDVFHAPGEVVQPVAVIDLDQVSFLDSMGLSALVKIRRLLAGRGTELVVVCGETLSRRVLMKARLETVMNLAHSARDIQVWLASASTS